MPEPKLSDQQRADCENSPFDFSGLRALFINCTLKPSPQKSHTDDLMGVAQAILEANKVRVESVRAVDLDLPPGVQPDMTEEGFKTDDWPSLYKKVLAADILVVGTPIWLGEKSSVCTRVIERLYGNSAKLNDAGQNVYYGRVGGCVVTGNEDGYKHCSTEILYSMSHMGFCIPPQADTGWVGVAGPGPSYGDEADDGGHVGYDNDFTQRNTTFMAWNLMHLARLLKDAGGFPAHGNKPKEWKAGCRFDHPNPEFRN